jgi:hypothetical protein
MVEDALYKSGDVYNQFFCDCYNDIHDRKYD